MTPPIDTMQAADADQGCQVDLNSDDGGEIRVEYVTFTNPALAPGMRENSARVFAFFMKNMDPDFFMRTPSSPPGVCTDLSARNYWPLAQGDNIEYIDPGQVLLANGTASVNIPHNTNNVDGLGRTHNKNDFFYFGTNDAATYMTPKGTHDVILTGSPTWPAHIYDDLVYIPDDFVNTEPSTTMVQVAADTPITWTWTPGDNSGRPPGFEVVAVIAFVVPGMGPIMVCIDTTNSGSLTVPAEILNSLRAIGTGGNLIRQNITHNVRPLTDNAGTCRRVDVIGVRCYTTPWMSI